MKFTAIWIDSWMSGSHRHSVTKKTFFECDNVVHLMDSEYGPKIVYLFEGHIPTLGETIRDEDFVKL
jgi:hypothetical protein